MAKNKSANRKLTGRDELNLIDYPLSIFSKHLPLVEDEAAEDNVKEIFITDPKTKKLKAGYVKITSNLRGRNAALQAGDEDVLIGLMELTAENGFKGQRVEFSSQNVLFSKIGWNRYGDNYQRLLDAFRRLRSLTIETNIFYDRTSKTYGHKIFGLLDEAYIATEAEKQSLDQDDKKRKPQGGYFIWNATIFESFQSGNVKYLDTELYRKIKSPGARKLFRVLDKRFYKYNVINLPLRYLSVHILNLEGKHGDWYLKRTITKYADELVKHEYLSSYEYITKNNVSHVEFKIKRPVEPEQGSFFEDNNGEEPEDKSADVYERLISTGFQDSSAKDLMRKYEISLIDDWLKCLEAGYIKEIGNKPGYLTEALKKGYDFPPTYTKLKREKVSKEIEKQREEQQRNCKICNGKGGQYINVIIDGVEYENWENCSCRKVSVSRK